MEFKGTKRKWIHHGVNRVRVEYGRCIAITYSRERKENARLISKAPEMLEMLESIVSTWDTNQNFDEEYFNNIRQLIKEATTL